MLLTGDDGSVEPSDVIDLFSPDFKKPEINRRQSLLLGASPTLFSEGNQTIADGITVSWRKNSLSFSSLLSIHSFIHSFILQFILQFISSFEPWK